MNGQHTPAELVRLVDRMQEGAGRAVRRAIPGGLRLASLVPGLHRTAISRARCGHSSNPVARLCLFCLFLWRTGSPKRRSLMMIGYVLDFVDELYVGVGERDARAASIAETDAECRANPLQHRFDQGDQSVIPELIDALREERAAMDELIISLEGRRLRRAA